MTKQSMCVYVAVYTFKWKSGKNANEDCLAPTHTKVSFGRAVGSSPGVGRLTDQSVDAPEGSEIEVRRADHSA